MTLHASHAGVSRIQVSRVLGLHHSVTRLAAKLDRLGELVRAVATERGEQQEHEGNDDHNNKRVALARHVEVDARMLWDFARCEPAATAAFEQDTKEGENDAGKANPILD